MRPMASEKGAKNSSHHIVIPHPANPHHTTPGGTRLTTARFPDELLSPCADRIFPPRSSVS